MSPAPVPITDLRIAPGCSAICALALLCCCGRTGSDIRIFSKSRLLHKAHFNLFDVTERHSLPRAAVVVVIKVHFFAVTVLSLAGAPHTVRKLAFCARLFFLRCRAFALA